MFIIVCHYAQKPQVDHFGKGSCVDTNIFLFPIAVLHLHTLLQNVDDLAAHVRHISSKRDILHTKNHHHSYANIIGWCQHNLVERSYPVHEGGSNVCLFVSTLKAMCVFLTGSTLVYLKWTSLSINVESTYISITIFWF